AWPAFCNDVATGCDGSTEKNEQPNQPWTMTSSRRQMALSPNQIPKIFGDVPAFMGVPFAPDLSRIQSADIVLIGMPYDGIATFRGGATRRAPQEIRKYSLLFGSYHLDWDMAALDHGAVADGGDVDVVPGNTPESYRRFEERMSAILGLGAIPIMMWGYHGVTYP